MRVSDRFKKTAKGFPLFVVVVPCEWEKSPDDFRPCGQGTPHTQGPLRMRGVFFQKGDPGGRRAARHVRAGFILHGRQA
jgi:hypothetical protein